MKKNLRYIIAFLLAIMMLLSLCACAQTGTAGNSGELIWIMWERIPTNPKRKSRGIPGLRRPSASAKGNNIYPVPKQA